MTGRSRFTAEELAKWDRMFAKAAKCSPEQLCALLTKYRALGRMDIVEVLSTELSGR